MEQLSDVLDFKKISGHLGYYRSIVGEIRKEYFKNHFIVNIFEEIKKISRKF